MGDRRDPEGTNDAQGRAEDRTGDLRNDVTRVLSGRGGAIVSDCVRIFSSSDSRPLDSDYCEQLGGTLLRLFSASVELRLETEAGSLLTLQRQMADGNLPIERLFTFVELMERTILDEVARGASIAAISERWRTVDQVIRRASFDVLGAYCGRSEQQTALPAITDKLTALYSRAMLDVVLPMETVRAERFSQRISLVVFEVDELPDLNRRCGYMVGDQLLERLGILIRHFFRQHDWVFRHGEGSIAVLLCQVAPQDALFLSLWVVAMVEQRLGFTDRNTDDRIRVTVSAALVSGRGSPDDPLDAERMLFEADSAMKRAKSLGGNRVEIATLEPGAAARDVRPQPAPQDQPPSS